MQRWCSTSGTTYTSGTLHPIPTAESDSSIAQYVAYALLSLLQCVLYSSLHTHKVSQRVMETDAPCIVKTKLLMAKSPGAVSLAQGVVHWRPPPEALQV